ncbi:MAG: hypothetical protein ABIF77_19050 [bacterium]
MKRTPRKLILNRETVRTLTARQLALIHTGGGTEPQVFDGPRQWPASQICSPTEWPGCHLDSDEPECPDGNTV